MKIRRYYGYDCESVMGFNNGSYVDDEPIEVKNEEIAFILCKDALAERWDLTKFTTEDLELQDDGIQLITGYYDDEGNEITRDKFLELNFDEERGSYRYVFVNYEVYQEETEE